MPDVDKGAPVVTQSEPVRMIVCPRCKGEEYPYPRVCMLCYGKKTIPDRRESDSTRSHRRRAQEALTAYRDAVAGRLRLYRNKKTGAVMIYSHEIEASVWLTYSADELDLDFDDSKSVNIELADFEREWEPA